MIKNIDKPNLFIVGGMRCGSTAIHEILGNHEQILMSEEKEPNYFRFKYLNSLPNHLKDKYSKYLYRKKNFRRYSTEEEYLSLFKGSKKYKYRGECSPYLYYDIGVAKLIKSQLKNVKIIISVRNPIDRFYSNFLFSKRIGKLNYDMKIGEYLNNEFDKLKNNKLNSLSKGFYIDRIFQWKKIFGDENVHVIKFENFKSDPEKTISELLYWLDLKNINYNILRSNPEKTGEIMHPKVFYFFTKNLFLSKVLK